MNPQIETMKTAEQKAEELYPMEMTGGGISKSDRQLQQNAFIKGFQYASQTSSPSTAAPGKSLQEIKSPESFLDDAIWRRWGQRLFDLANGMSGESFIALAKPQVIEAMELYASQFRTTPVQEEEIKAKLKAEYQRGYNAAQFNYNVGPYSDNE